MTFDEKKQMMTDSGVEKLQKSFVKHLPKFGDEKAFILWTFNELLREFNIRQIETMDADKVISRLGAWVGPILVKDYSQWRLECVLRDGREAQ